MKSKLTLLITGPITPPAGGVSMHIQRLAHLLRNDYNIDFIDESSTIKPAYFNFRKANPWSYLKKVAGCDVFFIHTGNNKLKKLHLLTGWLLRKKILVTLHGFGKQRSKARLFIDSLFYRLANKIIVVNPDICKYLYLPADKCMIKHAFLPPVIDSEPALPDDLSQWIQQKRSSHHTIFCANASRLNMHKGQDLYGLDMCIHLMRDLKKSGQLACMVFVLSSDTHGKELLEKYKAQIREYGLEQDLLLLETSLSFIRLIAAADIVLRPTNTDGDALTVREGLFLGKKVIASDVVERPTGTILFKTRNEEDLLQVVSRELAGKSQQMVEVSQQGDPGSYKTFYTNLIDQFAKDR